MKDRFKFRVWLEYAKLYYELDSFYYDRLKNKYTFHFEDGHTKTIKEKDCVIEQCTGLRDKNGKLIYEGDILKPNGNTITKEVVYEDGSYWAKDTIYFHDKCHIFQKWIDECGYEIVGNTHEKELK